MLSDLRDLGVGCVGDMFLQRDGSRIPHLKHADRLLVNSLHALDCIPGAGIGNLVRLRGSDALEAHARPPGYVLREPCASFSVSRCG